MSEALLDENLAFTVYRIMLLGYLGCAAVCMLMLAVFYGMCRACEQLSGLVRKFLELRTLQRSGSAPDLPKAASERPRVASVRSRFAARTG